MCAWGRVLEPSRSQTAWGPVNRGPASLWRASFGTRQRAVSDTSDVGLDVHTGRMDSSASLNYSSSSTVL
jgi:hypothetical protein